MERSVKQAINTILYLHCVQKGLTASQADREINKGTDPELYKKVKENYEFALAKPVYDKLLKTVEDNGWFGTNLPYFVKENDAYSTVQSALNAQAIKLGYTFTAKELKDVCDAKGVECPLREYDIKYSGDYKKYNMEGKEFHETEINPKYGYNGDIAYAVDNGLIKAPLQEVKTIPYYTYTKCQNARFMSKNVEKYLVDNKLTPIYVSTKGFAVPKSWGTTKCMQIGEDNKNEIDEGVGQAIEVEVISAKREIDDLIAKKAYDDATASSDNGKYYFIDKDHKVAQQTWKELADIIQKECFPLTSKKRNDAGENSITAVQLYASSVVRKFIKPGENDGVVGVPADRNQEYSYNLEQIKYICKNYNKEILASVYKSMYQEERTKREFVYEMFADVDVEMGGWGGPEPSCEKEGIILRAGGLSMVKLYNAHPEYFDLNKPSKYPNDRIWLDASKIKGFADVLEALTK